MHSPSLFPGPEVRGPHEPIVLAFVADEAFAMHLAVTLYSALVNLEPETPVRVYVLTNSIRPTTQMRIQQMSARTGRPVEVAFLPVDDGLFDAFSIRMKEEYSIASFYRLVLDTVLPRHHRRVLYLDCDMIVEDDLAKLWAVDMQGATMLAAPERTVSCPRYGVSRWRELGLPEEALYFNAGLAVIDLDRWRDADYGRRVLEYLDRYGDQLHIKGNQEGLNAVLAGDWTPLDPAWNVLNWYFDRDWFASASYGPVPAAQDLDRLTSRPKVIHYTTTYKPWSADCDHPLRHRYVHYLEQSGYLTPPALWAWRLQLAARRLLHRLVVWSRPYRHAVGARRRVWHQMKGRLTGLPARRSH
jgi:lipopolysaccharide biosynthesis glycosyltransferase